MWSIPTVFFKLLGPTCWLVYRCLVNSQAAAKCRRLTILYLTKKQLWCSRDVAKLLYLQLCSRRLTFYQKKPEHHGSILYGSIPYFDKASLYICSLVVRIFTYASSYYVLWLCALLYALSWCPLFPGVSILLPDVLFFSAVFKQKSPLRNLLRCYPIVPLLPPPFVFSSTAARLCLLQSTCFSWVSSTMISFAVLLKMRLSFRALS